VRLSAKYYRKPIEIQGIPAVSARLRTPEGLLTLTDVVEDFAAVRLLARRDVDEAAAREQPAVRQAHGLSRRDAKALIASHLDAFEE
jgi:hypothetical protein